MFSSFNSYNSAIQVKVRYNIPRIGIPSGVNFTPLTGIISWTPGSGDSSYNLWYSTSGPYSSSTAPTTGTNLGILTNPYTPVLTLQYGITYYISILAYSSAGIAASSYYVDSFTTPILTAGQLGGTIGSSSGNGTNGIVYAIAYDSIRNLYYVGGSFTTVGNSISAKFIAVWDPSNNIWSRLGSSTQNGTSSTVNALAFDSSNNLLYVCGNFINVSSSTQSSISAMYIAVWDASSQTWSQLGSASKNGIGNFGQTMAYDNLNNLLYVGGNFTSVTSATQLLIANSLAVWNVSSQTWASFGTIGQNGVDYPVYKIAYDSTNKLLYVGGSLTRCSSATQNAISAKYVAVWNILTQTWSPLGSTSQNGVNNAVYSLYYDNYNNILYVGGLFTTASSSSQNAISTNYIAKWNINTQVWFQLGSPTQNGVYKSSSPYVLAIVYDNVRNLLYVGGAFTNANSSSQSNIIVNNFAIWNINSNLWVSSGSTSQNGFNDTIQLMLYNTVSSILYIGGRFTQANSYNQSLMIYSNYIATLR